MDLKCPQCGSEATQKLTLVMSQGGTMEKGAQLGVSNIALPLATALFAIMFGIVFGMMSALLGLIAFADTIDLSAHMKQNGYQCNRCENQFVPV
jgi:hypothetical protein